jgi:iron(III) transport system substrate-binding protein
MPFTSRLRLLAASAATATVVASLAGCMAASGDSQAEKGIDSITSAAKKEGKLTWYTSFPEAVAKKAADSFTQEYGIDVQVVVLTSGLLAARYSSEMQSGSSPADVVMLADPLFFQDATSHGWTARLGATDTPNLAGWPKTGVHDGSYVLVNIQPIGVSFSTTKATAAQFKDWRFLTDPSLKNQLYLTDPRKVSAWLASMKLLADTYGDDFLKRIAAQKPKLVDSSVPGAQQLAAGSGTAVYPSLLTVSLPLSSRGSKIDTVFPSPTTGVEQYAAVSAKAPDPNAARLFVNWLMTRDAQTVLNKDTGSSPLGDLPGTLPLPDGYKTPDIPAAVKEKDRILADLGIK